MAEWRYGPVHSEPWHKMNVYRQLCILTTLCPVGKAPKCLWRREWVNPSSYRSFNHKNYLILPEIKPQFIHHPGHTSLYSEWNIQHLGLMDLWSFIPSHQRLIQYVSILNITITNEVHQCIGTVQIPITITKCLNWTEFGLQWHTAFSSLMKDFSLPFWLLTFSNSSIAIKFANTSNRCFLDLPGDSLWYGHCICHVMPVH